MQVSFCEHYVSKGDEILECCMNEQYYPFNLCDSHLPKIYLAEVSENCERPFKRQKLDNDTNNNCTSNPKSSEKNKNKRRQCIYIRRNGFQCLTGTTSDNGLCSQHKNCKIIK